MNGEAFKEYCRSRLGLTLRSGDSGIRGNLSAHKVAQVKESIKARDAALK